MQYIDTNTALECLIFIHRRKKCSSAVELENTGSFPCSRKAISEVRGGSRSHWYRSAVYITGAGKWVNKWASPVGTTPILRNKLIQNSS